MPIQPLKRNLNDLYARLHRRALVSPDPLQFLYQYPNPADREIVGLVAAGLAYGRVAQILRSVENALARIPSPAALLQCATDRALQRRFADFKHRFTTGEEMASLLIGVRQVLKRHGSLLALFEAGLSPEDETVLPALSAFVAELNAPTRGGAGSLLASPRDGSACKRMNLFLRWLVRRDDVDPGGWESVGARRLVMPLDTHIFRLGRALGLTKRRQADLWTAVEITAAFRTLAPEDPVRYDFALSRLGIRGDANEEEFLNGCAATLRAAGGRP